MSKKIVKNNTLIYLGVFLLLLFMASIASAQLERTLNIGNIRYYTSEGLNADDIRWPYAWDKYPHIHNNHLEMLETHGVVVAQKLNWQDPSGIEWDYQVGMAIQNKFSDQENVIVPVPGAFKRIFRHPYPSKILDGVDRTSITAAGDPVDPNLPADAAIYGKWEVWPDYNGGITIERWTYSFVNPDYTDIILNEWIFTNTSNETREDVYFAINSQTSAHDYYGAADRWGNYYGVTYWKHVQGDPDADSLRTWYSWDADLKATAEDEKGKPDPNWGNLEEPQYFTFSCVHADKSASDTSDDPRQPIKVQMAQREKWPDLNQATHPVIYNFLSKDYPVDDITNYSMRVDSTGAPNDNGRYEVLIPDFDERNFDSVTEQEKSCVMSFGPYTLKPGEDVRIVIAYTGGVFSQRLAIDVGRAYDAGYPQRQDFGIIPMPYDVYDLHGNKIISAGDIVTREQKDYLINNVSKELAFINAGKALKLWKNATFDENGHPISFNIPMPPASPSLYGFSENDQVRLTWDPVPGAVKYRIYREYQRRVESDEPTDTLYYYDPVNDIEYVETTETEFIDRNVVRGEDYYYYVVAVDENGLESSPFQNRTGTSAVPEDEALKPTRSADPNWQDSVIVVPNPYHASAAQKYDGRRLNFLNLPPYANIHIYTVLGDKVQTIYHDGNTGDEDWERQDTFSTMEIVSGVYIYVVEELDGPRGNPTGKKAIGKFVVIK